MTQAAQLMAEIMQLQRHHQWHPLPCLMVQLHRRWRTVGCAHVTSSSSRGIMKQVMCYAANAANQLSGALVNLSSPSAVAWRKTVTTYLLSRQGPLMCATLVMVGAQTRIFLNVAVAEKRATPTVQIRAWAALLLNPFDVQSVNKTQIAQAQGTGGARRRRGRGRR